MEEYFNDKCKELGVVANWSDFDTKPTKANITKYLKSIENKVPVKSFSSDVYIGNCPKTGEKLYR